MVTKEFIEFLSQNSELFNSEHHGIVHWMRVERNGLYLANFNGADKKVISYFAYLHDSMRVNDYIDPGHGKRAAAFAKEHRDKIDLDDQQFYLLIKACETHTEGEETDCPTLGACWDADRLDLTRVGFKVDPVFLQTEEAKKIAKSQDFSCLAQEAFSDNSVGC